MTDEFFYKKIISITNSIKKEDSFSKTYLANKLLNVSKKHPSFILKYKKKNFFLKNFFIYNFKNVFKIIITCYLNFFFKENKLKSFEKYDVILFSSLLKFNQKENEDLYFKEISNLLEKKKIKYLKVFINNLSIFQTDKFFLKKNNFIINKKIDLISLIKIHTKVFKIFIKYIFKKFSNDKYLSKIYKIIILEFLNPETINNLIIEKKIELFLKKIKYKNVIYTYEGFAWEKFVNYHSKKNNSSARAIGYQFAVLLKNQKLKDKNINKLFLPDVVWTTGNFNQRLLTGQFEKVELVGSDRGLPGIKNVSNKLEKIILVLPEGIDSECKLMLDFCLMCAVKYPDITFIIRFHPMIDINFFMKKIFKKEITKNILLSTKSFIQDLKRSSFFFYRGSTTSISALQYGLYPIYLNLYERLNIDPIVFLKNWKSEINDINDFDNFIKKKIHIVHKQTAMKKFVHKFSKNYFSKLNKYKIYSSLKS